MSNLETAAKSILLSGWMHYEGWKLLTPREQEIAAHLSRGWFNREIATALGISIKTVDTHRGHLLKKLGLRNNSELTRWMILRQLATAMELDIVTLEPPVVSTGVDKPLPGLTMETSS